jgi:DNA (cytosine-5)-methyltransferase 1
VFIIGHFGEIGRQTVFPIGENTTTVNIRIAGSTKGKDCTRIGTRDLVYDRSGIAPTLESTSYKQPLQILNQIGTIGKDSEATRVYNPDGIARTIKNGGGMGSKTGLYSVKTNTKKGYEIAKEGDSINLSVPNSKTRRGRVGVGVAQTIDTGMQQHTIQNTQIRRLTPTECERLQGFPDGWTAEGTEGKISDSQRYKCLGNAVTVNVIKAIAKKIKLLKE